MRVNISDLKDIVSKINLAIEKTKINPKSGWIEFQSFEGGITIKAANFDYYLEARVGYESDIFESIHATVSSDTFIPLISKLDSDSVDICISGNSLKFATEDNEYNFPLIKELGKVKTLDKIVFRDTQSSRHLISGHDLFSIANSNVKGLLDSLFSTDIQQFIYFDNFGAITFTENIYINNFNVNSDEPVTFKILLNSTQAKLLKIFELDEEVKLYIEMPTSYESNFKVKFKTDNIDLIFIVQSMEMSDKFPSIKLRRLAEVVNTTHVIIDKKKLDRALARLMVFDKKFDITVMNYSKLVFKKDYVELVSIRNRNIEKIPYISSTNPYEREVIIRFADLTKQLKAIMSKEIDISYGDTPAIAISSEELIQLIPEIQASGRV